MPGIFQSIIIHLCRDAATLEQAQHLRYVVYCEELGRDSPYADHNRRLITDPLDAFAHVFFAVENGQVIGTLRGNRPTEGPLGDLEGCYGMTASPCHPIATAICTKFVVRKDKRRGPTALKLVAAMVRHGLEHGVRECYADSIPPLLPYYRALGFEVTGGPFNHCENGPSYPMVLDVVKHAPRLVGEQGTLAALRLGVKAKWLKSLQRATAVTVQAKLERA